MPRNAAQQKSQTPLITGLGFECPGLSGPGVAAEGLEQVLQTIAKRKEIKQCEAKSESLSESSTSDLNSLADVLAVSLDKRDVLELIRQLALHLQVR